MANPWNECKTNLEGTFLRKQLSFVFVRHSGSILSFEVVVLSCCRLKVASCSDSLSFGSACVGPVSSLQTV